MPKPDPKPNPSEPPFGWESATVVSQNISFDSGAGRYMNYVEADTADYHYRWLEQNTNHMLVVIVNASIKMGLTSSWKTPSITSTSLS